MAWTTPSTWAAAAVVTAAQLNQQLRDNMKAIGDPWSTWTLGYGGMTIGNGVVVAKYMQAGKLVHGYFKMTVGSTSTFSGQISIQMPVAAAQFPNMPAGSAFYYDNSAGIAHTGTVLNSTSSGWIFVDNAGFVANTTPWTWATSDILAFEFTYEAA